MFITNHVVEDPVERQAILERFPSLSPLDSSSLELLAVAMDDEEVVGIAATGNLSPRGSRLLGFDLVSDYSKVAVELGLFNYLAWELKGKKKSFLVIEPGLDNPAMLSMLRELGCEAGEKTVVKIDWNPVASSLPSFT
jgi:hypothetical protein